MKFIASVLSIFFFFFFLVATQVEAQALQKTLKKYSKAKSLQFDIKKTDEKIIMGTRSEYKGLLKFQKNKIYIMQDGDKKVEVFYMDKTLTLVEYPDADFGPAGKRKVTVLKNADSPLIKSLLSLFSTPKVFNQQFATISEKNSQGISTVELKPKAENIKNLFLKVNAKNSKLLELSFTDDVETKTTMQFDNEKLNNKMRKSEFQYKLLTTDEVLTQ